MRIYDPDNAAILYHLHIPKTAGTTVRSMLRDRFPRDRVCSEEPLQVIQHSPEQLRKFDLFGGHLEFGYYLPQLTGRRVETVVFLRQPRNILLSMYRHVLDSEGDQMRAYVLEHCPDLESFLHDPVIEKYIHNPQTRYLGIAERRFTVDTVARIRQATKPAEVQAIVKEANDKANGASRETIIARAHQRLTQCAVVGLVEQLDESLRRVCDLRHWPPQEQFRSRNVSQASVAKPVEKSPAVMRRLEELCEWDLNLYDVANAMFARAGEAARRTSVSRRAA